MRSIRARGAAALFTACALTACGDTDQDNASAGVSDVTVVVEITITGGQVSPVGEEVEASVGQPIELRVDSDTADELHVHSEPEQEFEVEAEPGTDQVFTFTVDVPGQAEIESHETGVTIVTLVVQP